MTQNLFFTCLPPSLSHHFIRSPSFFYILHKEFSRHVWQDQIVENKATQDCMCFQSSFLLSCPQADWRKVSTAAFCSCADSELNYVLSPVQHSKAADFSQASLMENYCCGFMLPALQTSVRNSEGFSSAVVPRPMLVTL